MNASASSESDLDDQDPTHTKNTPILPKIDFKEHVTTLIAREKWTDLLIYDELNRELLTEKLLPGFLAPFPYFPPTFKRTRNAVIQHLPDHLSRFKSLPG